MAMQLPNYLKDCISHLFSKIRDIGRGVSPSEKRGEHDLERVEKGHCVNPLPYR